MTGRGRGRGSSWFTEADSTTVPPRQEPDSTSPSPPPQAAAADLAPGLERVNITPGTGRGRGRGRGILNVFEEEAPPAQEPPPELVTSMPGRGRGRGRGIEVPLQMRVPPPGLPLPADVEDASSASSSSPQASEQQSSVGLLSSAQTGGSGSSGVSSSDPSGSGQGAAGPSVAQARQLEAEEEPGDGASVSASVPSTSAPAAQTLVYRGDKGTPARVLTNFIRIKIQNDFGVFEYKVSFVPHLEDTRGRKTAIRSLDALGKTKIFDGVKLYLPNRLADGNLQFKTIHPHDATQELTVKLQLVGTAVEQKVQFYNVLIRKLMHILKFTEIKRDFFNPRKVTNMEKYNLEVWPGYTSTVDVYKGGLMLCLNSTFRVLRKDTILEMLNQERQKNPSSFKKIFEEKIMGNSVITRYNNKHYKIHDVAWDQNPNSTFERRGVQIAFTDFYAEQHGKEIFDKTQPLLASRIKARKNDPRGETYFVSLVPEFCHQSGLTDDMRANVFLMRDLIALSRTTPIQRRAAIIELLESIRANAEAQETLAMWGIRLDTECLPAESRILPGPKLQFGATVLPVAPADFTRDATSNKCFQPVALKRWQIYCTGQDRVKGEQMVTQYRQVAPPLGITFGPPPEYVIVSNRSGRGIPSGADFRQALKGGCNPKEIQFVVVILPMAKDDLYAAVKRYCLTDVSIPSQVILGKTLQQDKKLRSVMQKVALQINCKLGGSLWALNIPLKDLIMFVGIDAHHDPSQKKKSVLALVASLDNYCTQYYSRIVNQMAHQESADAIRPVFLQALAAFYTLNSRYPDRIVVFRDGVGDGMLELVKTNEVSALRDAAHSVCDPRTLKFIFVVVQKRINERIFAVKGNQLDNPVPGSILDHTITRRGMYDFFLICQLVRQGTVGPSHFIVLEDTDENKPDLIQRLSYVTSYMYYNWPGSVRLPAMCQYAHKLSMLVGQHLDADPLTNMDRMLYYL